MTIDPQEAAASLAAMRDAKSRMGNGPRWHWGQHLFFGALMAELLALNAAPTFWRGPGMAAFALGLVMHVRWTRRTSGRFINGFRAGRTRWVALALVATFVPICLVSIWFKLHQHVALAPLWGAAIVFVIATLADRLWVIAYDADLRDGR